MISNQEDASPLVGPRRAPLWYCNEIIPAYNRKNKDKFHTVTGLLIMTIRM